MEYKFLEIERKWQELWEKEKTFKTLVKPSGEKIYILDMFPYPSGSGLHVGHPLGYTATDIYARFKRMNGFSVLHPMGFDSFGLPAEQHAIATGEHPSIETERNCARFREQLKRVGFSYDWDREIKTSDKNYYKWTQYIFTLLYNSYYDEKQNRARHISELEIPAGISDPLEIQDYQDKFRLAYLDYSYVNFCPELGTVLANEEVIDGKSERGGYDVIRIPIKQWVLRITAYAERLLDDLADLDWPESIKEQQRNWIGKSYGHKVRFFINELNDYIECFTTRLDTLPGVTFIAIAPEVAGLDKRFQTNAKVTDFLHNVLKKSERDRAIEKSKNGVNTGLVAINPLTQEPIPIFVAEYVLSGYGTGVVMGVPAHDQRDFEFAIQNNLPIRQVVYPRDKIKVEGAFTEEGVILELKLKGFSFTNISSEEAKKLICEHLPEACTPAKSFKLRDWIFSRQRYWGEPIPIIHWEDGLRSCLELKDLPLELPHVSDFTPTKDGSSPLAKVKDWIEVRDPKTGKKGFRDTNTMPQWAGSCWYYLRFIDPHNDADFVNHELEKLWMPVDLYVGGAEHAVLHLLYARFWHKFLYDLGKVSTSEPFKKLFNQGMVLSYAYKDSRGALVATDQVVERDGKFYKKDSNEPLEQIVAKMSKSLRNVIDPLEVINEYGADTLRLYLMFMGPLNEKRIWNTKAVMGIFRFLKRVYAWIQTAPAQDDDRVSSELNKLVYKVTDDIEKLRFNTAIAAMMEFLNFVETTSTSIDTRKTFIKLLSPFAPHLAEECWEILGEPPFISNSSWPKYDLSLLSSERFTVVVQINGKKKRTFEVSPPCSDEDIKIKALELLGNLSYKKCFVVKDKGNNPCLINFVV